MRSLIKRLLLRGGYDICDRDHSSRSMVLAARLLERTKANILIDVGANSGQYSSEILSLRPKTRIISFEPLSAAHSLLREKAKAHSGWTVRERVAVGASSGVARINVAGNSVSSSMLEMTSLHLQAEPASRYEAVEVVPMEPLDKVLAGDLTMDSRLYLKIDTQGYEKQVLDGAGQALKHIVAIQLELSFAPLYDGQALALEMMGWLQQAGFRPFGFSPGLRQAATGELLQMDGFFMRAEPLKAQTSTAVGLPA